MERKTCFFIGHRDAPETLRPLLAEAVERHITRYSVTEFVVGHAKAVSWAESLGIVSGYGDGKFGPNDPITREQLAAILYRYAQYKGQGFQGLWSFRLDFPDAGDVSDWATEAMSWMVMQGVVNGKDGFLVPGGNASRAEAATMLMRFCTKLAA